MDSPSSSKDVKTRSCISLIGFHTCFSEPLLFNGSHGGSDGEGSSSNVGDPGSIPGLGRYPGEGTGAWQATVHGVVELDTTEMTNTNLFFITFSYYFEADVRNRFIFQL